MHGLDIAESAKAVVAPGTPQGLRPFSVCKTDAEWLQGHPTQAKTLVFDSQGSGSPTGCGLGPGNWGFVQLDNNQGGGNADIASWIKYGYADEVDEPQHVDCPRPRLRRQAAQTEMSVILAEVDIPLPVYDSFSGNGANSAYHVVGSCWSRCVPTSSEGTARPDAAEWQREPGLRRHDGGGVNAF